MPDEWHVLPEALRRARLTQLLTAEALAKKSGVSLRSINRYESTEQRVRLETLQCLATALATDVQKLARLRASDKPAAAKPAAAPARPSALPSRTDLETLVDIERAEGIELPPVATPSGPVPVLTAKRLQDVFTAFAVHAGKRLHLRGRVDTQRGIAADEAALLRSHAGVAARFHIVQEIVAGHPIGVTVHTATAEHTAALQAAQGSDASLVVRVTLAENASDTVGFTSFITKVATRRPWTFVVEEILAQPAASAPPSPRKSGRRTAPAGG